MNTLINKIKHTITRNGTTEEWNYTNATYKDILRILQEYKESTLKVKNKQLYKILQYPGKIYINSEGLSIIIEYTGTIQFEEYRSISKYIETMSTSDSDEKYSPKLLAFSGPKGSGKSTAVRYMRARIANTAEVSFALPLKEVISNLWDIPMENLQDQTLKEQILDEYGVTPRDLCIAVGDCLRFDLQKRLPQLKIKRNVLTDKAQRTIHKLKKEKKNIGISDTRDPVTECEMLREEGFQIVDIKRPAKYRGGQIINHWTENGIPNPDHIIENDGTPQELYKKIDTLLFLNSNKN